MQVGLLDYNGAYFAKPNQRTIDMTEQPQTSMHGYDIYELVGRGAHSQIYRAIHAKSGTVVALKVLQPQLAEQEEFILRYEGEVESIKKLGKNKHIIKLYDYWRSEKGAFMVLQWLGGGDLETDLAVNGVYRLQDAVKLFIKIGSALAAAHQIGIIHRDIKPSNIMFDEQQTPYLTDFGIAKRSDADITVPGTLLGSPAYLAPEQLLNKPISPATDVYSLAVNLYETLVGTTPYHNMPMTKAMMLKIREPLPSILEARPDLPPALAKVIIRSTAVQASERYDTVEAFLKALKKAVGA